MKIGDRTKELQADHERRALPRACMEGLEAFKRDASLEGDVVGDGKTRNRWAWPRPGDLEYESDGSSNVRLYDRKIQGARLVNVWKQTVLAAASVPFVNSPTLKGWPVAIMGDPEDPKTGFKASVDDQGLSLGAFWASLFLWKLVDGVNYNLVTKPADDPGDAYFVAVGSHQMLEPVMGARNGRQELAEVRLLMPSVKREDPTDDPEKWPETKMTERVLVYRTAERHRDVADRQMAKDGPPIYRYAKKVRVRGKDVWQWDGDWRPLLVRAGNEVTEIPLYPHYGLQVAPYRGWPVFEDTASQQAAHWRKMLDYDRRVYKDSVNIITVTGAEPGETKEAGPNKAAKAKGDVFYVSNPEATVGHIETTGQALKGLREDFESIEQSIRIGNLRPLLSQPSPSRTATEIYAYTVSASSLLEMWIVQDFAPLRRALAMKCRLDGLDPEGGDIELPHDFNLNPEALDRLWKGYLESGGKLVPPEVVWPELRRQQAISESIDADEIAATIKKTIDAGTASPPPSIPPSPLQGA